ncbi:MAG: hypothetical protein COC07_07955, partial [Erythrobacteraceae bacterium]
MRHIAIVGSGPAGYYTAEAAVKKWGEDARIDVFDKLPVPFGLIRTGVAPDHQSIKAVARRYEKTAIGDTVRFVGNVAVGEDITIAELGDLYDAMVLATGAPVDRALPIAGAEADNVIGSAAFVGWYNGHPEFAALDPQLSGKHAVVVGGGLLGLEAANGLMLRGMQVTVVHISPWLMERQLDEVAGKMLQKSLEDRGLKFMIGDARPAIGESARRL